MEPEHFALTGLMPETVTVPGPLTLDHDSQRAQPLQVTDAGGYPANRAVTAILETRLAALEAAVEPFRLTAFRGQLPADTASGHCLDLQELSLCAAWLEAHAVTYPAFQGRTVRVTAGVRGNDEKGFGPPFTAPFSVHPGPTDPEVKAATEAYTQRAGYLWMLAASHVLGPWMGDTGIREFTMAADLQVGAGGPLGAGGPQ